jgi:1,4-dihydroxy-2-naphthoate polyprenyltransferase
MTKNQAWWKALRLRTLPLSLSGIILGSFIALSAGHWDAAVFVLAMMTTVLFQILSNFANDLGDSKKGADNKERIGPVRAVQSGMISQKEMKYAVFIIAILSLLSAVPLVLIGTENMPIESLWIYLVLAGMCVLAAITYTVGKRAYGYNGLGDLFVFIFFGGVSVIGVNILFSKVFDPALILPAVSMGLLSTAVLNLNNMRDFSNDKKAGKRTLVVLMGGDVAKLYHFFLVISGLICMAVFLNNYPPITRLGLLPGILLLIHLRTVMKTKYAKDYDPELKKVVLATFALSVLISIFLNVA